MQRQARSYLRAENTDEIGESADRQLVREAVKIAATAYAPYSNFHVGAAVRLKDGSIIAASNVENASYGLGICAEVAALCKANAAGGFDSVEAIAISGHGPGSADPGSRVYPCGRCRQFIFESASLSGKDIDVICANADGTSYDVHPISELLPHAFGPESLIASDDAKS